MKKFLSFAIIFTFSLTVIGKETVTIIPAVKDKDVVLSDTELNRRINAYFELNYINYELPYLEKKISDVFFKSAAARNLCFQFGELNQIQQQAYRNLAVGKGQTPGDAFYWTEEGVQAFNSIVEGRRTFQDLANFCHEESTASGDDILQKLGSLKITNTSALRLLKRSLDVHNILHIPDIF